MPRAGSKNDHLLFYLYAALERGSRRVESAELAKPKAEAQAGGAGEARVWSHSKAKRSLHSSDFRRENGSVFEPGTLAGVAAWRAIGRLSSGLYRIGRRFGRVPGRRARCDNSPVLPFFCDWGLVLSA